MASAIAAAGAGVAGCRGGSGADSPEGAIAGFFAALNQGRIPGELDTLVGDAVEQERWRLRCQLHGCSGGQFTVVRRSRPGAGDWRTTLHIDYEVTGAGGAVVMRGRDAPVRLQRLAGGWRLLELAAPQPPDQPPAAAASPQVPGEVGTGQGEGGERPAAGQRQPARRHRGAPEAPRPQDEGGADKPPG